MPGHQGYDPDEDTDDDADEKRQLEAEGITCSGYGPAPRGEHQCTSLVCHPITRPDDR